MNEKSKKELSADKVYWLLRLGAVASFFMLFFPNFNASRLSGMISENLSLFTSAVSYNSLTTGVGRTFIAGWVDETTFYMIMVLSILVCLASFVMCAGACLSLGNRRCKRLGNIFSIVGALVGLASTIGYYVDYTIINQQATDAGKLEKINPMLPKSIIMFIVLFSICLIASIVVTVLIPKAKGMRYFMEAKYKLFLMFVPIAILGFVFCYLPLYGWRYAFFDYKAGQVLSMNKFTGFKWFKYLFQNAATRGDIVRVLKNTLVMSGLGIATSWVAMAFAIFLNEMKSVRFRRFVQIFTTIPNFISWVLVYSLALALFASDGFVNELFGIKNTIISGDHYTWIKMLIWGMWKGTGWSAIIYIAGISGIDPQLYEAATVDGAGRFQKMWHITVPGLIPTYCVILLMSIANILSNGMDQYYVFKNAQNSKTIEVLDLYTYTLGITNGLIPLSTVVGMAKSIISIILLFVANGISKLIRGESII